MTLRGHEGDDEVTNTVQERSGCADKNISRYRTDELQELLFYSCSLASI